MLALIVLGLSELHWQLVLFVWLVPHVLIVTSLDDFK